MSLLSITAYDKLFYEKELKDFLPDRIIDCHNHIWLKEFHREGSMRGGTQPWSRLIALDNSMEDLLETNRVLFPGKEVIPVLYGDFVRTIDHKRNNAYVAACADANNCPALYLTHPNQSAEELEQAVLANPHFKGLKVYLQFAPSYIPDDELRIYDFLTKEHLAVCDKHGWVVQLHIARPRRLADPVNYHQILEIEQQFPNVPLSIAHLGRAYANEDLGRGLDFLMNTKNTIWDFTANTNVYVMEKVLEYFGPDRMMYGSDFPTFRMKARRVVENGVYINEIPRGSFPYESIKDDVHMREIDYPEAEKITFFVYETILASQKACARLGLSKEDVEKIYFGTAARVFGVK